MSDLGDAMKNTLKPVGRAFTSQFAKVTYIIGASIGIPLGLLWVASTVSGPETRPTQDDFAGNYHQIERGSGRIGLLRNLDDNLDVDAIIYHRNHDSPCIEAIAVGVDNTTNWKACLGGPQTLSAEERASWSKIALELDNARYMRAVNNFDYRAAKKAEREAKK